MKKLFKSANHHPTNVLNFTESLVSRYPALQIYAGTDSVVVGDETHFYFVIAYRYGKNGATFLYDKLVTERLASKEVRLWREVEITIDWIKWLEENDICVDVIEFDLNTDTTHVSSMFVDGAKGWANSMGYKVAVKPETQIAVKAANFLCQ